MRQVSHLLSVLQTGGLEWFDAAPGGFHFFIQQPGNTNPTTNYGFPGFRSLRFASVAKRLTHPTILGLGQKTGSFTWG